MFLLEIGLPQTCFEIALTWLQAKVRLRIHKGSIGTTYKISHTISAKRMILWSVGSGTIHQGARMVFFMMNLIDILEHLRMLVMITTHLLRDFMKL